MEAQHPVRLAAVGGNRGFAYTKTINLLEDEIELVAICDLNEQVFEKWKTLYPEIKTFTSYEKLLDDDSIDAVLIATPLLIHARQSIQALKAGRHVLCEVSSTHTLEECWELVETVRK